jgi:hypothetical protein
MLKNKVKKLEKQLDKEKYNDNGSIYNKDVVIIRSLKDFVMVYGSEEDDPPERRVKPTAKILWTKEMRNWADHFYDDDDEIIDQTTDTD